MVNTCQVRYVRNQNDGTWLEMFWVKQVRFLRLSSGDASIRLCPLRR